MKQKRIVFILLIIVLLPILFYSVYEINSLSDNEQFISEIYQKQMNLILYSVNKYSWDTAKDWANEIDNILNSSFEKPTSKWDEFLYNRNVIRSIIITDSVFSNILRKKLSNQSSKLFVNKQDVLDFLNINKSIIKKLYARKNAGYEKIEAIPYPQDNSYMVMIYISENYSKQTSIVMMLIDVDLFINNVLNPILQDVTRGEFTIGIFKANTLDPIYSIGSIKSNEIKIQKNFWLFQDYFLGIALAGTTIEDITQSRFQRSLYLILILGIMLIISAYFLIKNIRHEMELARMKSEFVSNVSHELRTPLALIRMFAETIELDRVESNHEVKEFSKIIGYESERLTHIINNILDFSKIEAGKKQYEFQQVDLNNIVSNILTIYKFHLQNKGFTININLSEKSLPTNADKESITEIMVNLIDNAVKYSDKIKGISIKTGAEKEWVFVEIEDKGIGIPTGKLDHIFDKFYRIRDNQNGYVKGSGLGLTLVKKIMDAHNGEIEVFSKPGKGSKFKLKFKKA